MLYFRVAGGDFSEKIKVTRSDEFGVLEKNFNGMMDDVSGLIHAVEDKSNHILEVAGGISEVAGNTKTTIASGNFDLLGKITARHTMCRILEFFDLAVKTERCQDCDHTSKDQTDHTGHQRSYVNVDQVLLVFLITDTAEQSPSGSG